MISRYSIGPLARKFAWLALLIALPFSALSIYLLLMSLNELPRLSRDESRRIASMAVLSIDAWYRDQVGDMEILARLPVFERAPSPIGYAILKRTAEIRPNWHGISLIAPSGQLQLYTLRPFGAKLPSVGELSATRKVVITKKPQLSDAYVTKVEHIPGVGIAVPILRSGRVIGIIGTVHHLEDVGASYLGTDRGAGIGLQPNASQGIITIVDTKGTVVYRSLDAKHWVGRNLGEHFRAHILPGSRSGGFQAVGPDGVDRIYTYQVAPLTGWMVLVGNPVSATQGIKSKVLSTSLMLGMTAVVSTLVLALAMARRFTRPALELRDAANAFGAGDLDRRAKAWAGDELGELGAAFNEMADRIQGSQTRLEEQVADRTHALVTSNAALEASNSRLQALNEQLSAAMVELSRLEQQRADFLNMVSHDLRIPLTAIQGYAEFLEDGVGGPLSPQQVEYLHGMTGAIENMTRLLEQLLDYARVESGHLKLDWQLVDLAEFLPDAIAPLRVLAERKHQELVIRETSGLALVCADPERIQQVIGNFISNAVKYTQEHGRIEICLEGGNGRVRVLVSDNGPGIAPEDQAHLFQRFYRAQAAKPQPGTGLGLSIAKGIMDAHGGRIGVISQPGRGSTFWFELDAAKNHE